MREFLRRAMRNRPLASYRLKRLKQALTTARQALSSLEPFDEQFITTALLDQTINDARVKANAPPVVFTDSTKLLRHCARRGLTSYLVTGATFEAPGSAIQIAVYAVNKYSNGHRLIHWLFKERIPFLAVGVDIPSSVLSEDSDAEAAIRDAWKEQLADGWSKFDLHVGGDFENLFQVVRTTAHVPGVYLEVGVFHGSSADVVLRYMAMRGLKRRCVFLDSFDSFTYDTAIRSPDRRWTGTHTEVSQELTTARLLRHQTEHLKVEVRKVDICEPNALTDIDMIACANVDVDLYEAILAAADHIIPRLSIGGAMVIEDAGQGVSLVGARAALDVILERHPTLFHYQTFSGQHVLVRVAGG